MHMYMNSENSATPCWTSQSSSRHIACEACADGRLSMKLPMKATPRLLSFQPNAVADLTSAPRPSYTTPSSPTK